MDIVSLPKWPQKFEMRSRTSRKFAFPVMTPGKIALHFKWDGLPIDITLFSPDRTPVLSLSQQDPPRLDLEYEVTDEHTHQGAIWVCSIQVAQNGQAHLGRAAGAIRLDAPRIGIKEKRQLSKLLEPCAAVFENNRIKLNEAMLKHGEPLPAPVISRIVPDHALPSQYVTIEGQHFAEIAWNNEVYFALGSSLERAYVDSVTLDEQVGDRLRVRVPFVAPLRTRTDGSVFVHRVEPWEADSTPRKFGFDPETPPDISRVTPSQGGECTPVTVEGSGFGTDKNLIKILFKLPNDAELDAPAHTLSDTLLTTEVPPYIYQGHGMGKVILRRRYPRTWIEGRSADFMIRSSEPIIYQYDCWNPVLPEYKGLDFKTLSPQGWVWIQGEGFGDLPGRIMCRPLPNQNPGDRINWSGDRPMNIYSWENTEITAMIPDDEYRPFEAEFYLEITKPSGQTVRTPPQLLHIVPTYESKPIDYGTYNNTDVEVGMPTAWAGDSLPSDYWQSAGDQVFVHHGTDFWAGRNGNDLFFRGVTLKNHFFVERITLNVLSDKNETEATITESHIGTNNPFVKIHWSNSVYPFPWPFYQQYPLMYTLSIRLRGPKGYDYK